MQKKMLLAALTAAALLSPAMFGSQAQAITVAVPSAANDAGLVQKAAVVCGYRGCVRTWHPYGYYRPYGYYGYRQYRWGYRRWY
jgi:hypothetical protein